MQTKKRELESIVLDEKQVEIKRAEIVKEIDIGKLEIARMEKEIEGKEKIKDELIYITELENWISIQFLELISFIEKSVMLRLREEFSKLFNEWFSILVPDTFNVRLDEPTDGFSQQQLDKMRDVLQQLKVNQLIIVSHDQKMEGFVDNIIRLKKTQGVTSIAV